MWFSWGPHCQVCKCCVWPGQASRQEMKMEIQLFLKGNMLEDRALSLSKDLCSCLLKEKKYPWSHHLMFHILWFHILLFLLCSKKPNLCKWCVRTVPSKWQQWLQKKLRSWSFRMPVGSWACWCCCLTTSLTWKRYGPGRQSCHFSGTCLLSELCCPFTPQQGCAGQTGAQQLPGCYHVLRQRPAS